MQKPRIKPNQPLTFYHVMTRTAQKAFLLENPEFKAAATSIIRTFAKIYYVEIHGWVLMDNHYHLCLSVMKPEQDSVDLERRFDLLQTQLKHPQEWREWNENRYYRRFTDLSMFMWEINRRIAVAYNQIHDSWGHFWGARFKSKVIEDEHALMKVLAYIEQNPVRAGLAKKPSEYPYGSAGQLKNDLELGDAPKAPKIAWLRGIQGKERVRAYLIWNDYLSLLIHQPEMIAARPPPELISQGFKIQDQIEVCAELRTGGPSNWSTPGYGSPTFVASLIEQQKARQIGK